MRWYVSEALYSGRDVARVAPHLRSLLSLPANDRLMKVDKRPDIRDDIAGVIVLTRG